MEQIQANALGSIRVGLEDFQRAQERNDDDRYTSAVRNVFAGILLLAKAKLYALSPADSNGILIRMVRPKPENGVVKLVADGKKTIDYEELKRRFTDCGLNLEWRRVDQIHRIRNDLEHFYHTGSKVQVRQALADAAMVIHELLRMLELDPVGDLGGDWWQLLLNNKEVFEAELKECRASLSGIRWANDTAAAASEHFSCRACGSSLLKRDETGPDAQEEVRLVCRTCGTADEMAAFIIDGLQELYPQSPEDALVQPKIGTCPECGRDAFVFEEQVCAMCDFTVPDNAECAVCGEGLSPEDYHEHGGLCSYHAYVLSKDD